MTTRPNKMGQYRLTKKDLKFLTARASTGLDIDAYDVADFRNAGVLFSTAGSANLTVKFKGAVGSVPPDFSAAQSNTNRWEYVQCVDLKNGTPIDGDVGLVWAGTDANRFVELNLNVVDWIALEVTARAAGNVTASMTITDNS